MMKETIICKLNSSHTLSKGDHLGHWELFPISDVEKKPH